MVEFTAGDGLSSIIIKRLFCCEQVVLSPSKLVKLHCEWLKMATLLDPRFKGLKGLDQT